MLLLHGSGICQKMKSAVSVEYNSMEHVRHANILAMIALSVCYYKPLVIRFADNQQSLANADIRFICIVW